MQEMKSLPNREKREAFTPLPEKDACYDFDRVK